MSDFVKQRNNNLIKGEFLLNTKEKNQWSHICHLWIKSIIIIYDYNNIGGTYSQLPTSAKMWAATFQKLVSVWPQSGQRYLVPPFTSWSSLIDIDLIIFFSFIFRLFYVVLTAFPQLRNVQVFKTIYNIAFHSCHNNNKGVNNLILGVNEKNVWFCQTT